MTTTVYGASDDLIEVEGAIREEFPGGDDPRYLAFSNGVVLKVHYDDEGFWRILPRANSHRVTIDSAFDVDDLGAEREDGSPGYSDRATLDGDVTWVVCGDEFSVAPAATR